MTTTGDQPELHPYWNVWLLIQTALDASKPDAAAAAFHRGVSLMQTEIPAAEKDPSRMPAQWRELRDEQVSDYDQAQGITTYFSYPLLGQDAFAFAAVRKDMGSLEILDSFCGRYDAEEPEPCSADYLRIVQTVLDMVAASEVTDIKDVRKVFSQEDRIRLRSVWRAMRDAKFLIVESQGQKVFFHRSAPELVSSTLKPVPFRKGKPAAETVLLTRPEHLRGQSWDRRDENLPSFDQWPPATPEETKLPKENRRTRKSTSVSVGDKTWLQDVAVSKRTDGSYYTPIVVINADGSHGPTVDFGSYGRLRSSPQGDCGIFVNYHDLVVRIRTADANEAFAFSLFATPEVSETVRGFGERGLKASTAIRSVHASLAAERFVVSVINKVFVYTFDGDVIAAFHLDDERSSKTYGSQTVSSSKPDWAYFVQLAVDGQGLYVGAYSGLLLHLSFTGEIIDSWILPGVPEVLRETSDGISGTNEGSFFFRAGRGSGEVECQFVDIGGAGCQLVGDMVLLDSWTSSGVFDLEGFEGRTVKLPKPRTAAYIANGRLVMETAMTRHTF